MKKPQISGEVMRDRIKRGLIIFAVSAFLIGSVGTYIFVIFSNNSASPSNTPSSTTNQQQEMKVDPSLQAPTPITTLKVEDIAVGTGAEAKAGSTIKVTYKGALAKTGQVFDQSAEPIELPLDAVIPGWQEGIPGMKVGGKRKLLIPAEKAYGAQGTPDGSIPPNSDLVFEVGLFEVK